MDKSTSPIIMIVVALVVAGASFYAGTQYQLRKQPGMMGQFGNGSPNGNRMQGGRFQGGQGGQGGGRAGFRPVAGEITKADATSITVKLQDGSSRIVIMSDKTDINKATNATRDELKAGERVAVFGTENADGTVTAQNIQLNPILRGMGMPTGTPQK